MTDKAESVLPPHLKGLLHPTPSGAAKLIAAWEGLSVESQIMILTELEEVRFPAYLKQQVYRKALDSSNAYVRYLAARKFYFSSDDKVEKKVLKERIEADSDPLVRYCLLESEWNFLDQEIKDPESFFNLPHEARLAKVRELDSSGEAIASLVAYAVDDHLTKGKVSEVELYEILADYLNKPSFRQHYGEDRWRSRYDGFGEYMAGKDIEALWGLVPKLPEGISHILIEHLPEQAGLNSGIPENVLDHLAPGQLETLLYRKDIVLEKLRRKIFEQPAERLDRVRSAAISCNFNLSYDDFATILSKPDEEKIDTLRNLAVMSGDLSLVFYEAIHDVLSAVDDSLSGAWEDAGMAEVSFERKANNLTGWQREKQLRELRLYRLAKQAVPGKSNEKGYRPTDKLEFLANSCVEEDTWATFVNFSKEWDKHSRHTKSLEKLLPRIYEVGEEDLEIDVEETVFETIRNMRNDFSRLEANVNRQKVLLCVVIGLLVWLLVARF